MFLELIRAFMKQNRKLTPISLMAAVEKAVKAFDEKKEQSKNGEVFSTEQEVRDFFQPFFEMQKETDDILFFVIIVMEHKKYNFFAGGVF